MGYNEDEGGTWDWEVTIFKLSGDELEREVVIKRLVQDFVLR